MLSVGGQRNNANIIVNMMRPPNYWLPVALDFHGDLRAALKLRDPAGRLEQLSSLAQYRLDFQETLQLGQALDRLTLESNSALLSVRLAVLASSTIGHLRPAIRVAGLRRRMLIDVYSGAYGQYRQDILDTASLLHSFAPQVILFSLSARDTIATVPMTATATEVNGTIAQSVGEIRLLWRKARETFNASIIQQTFLDTTETIFGSYDRLVPGAPTQVIAKLNDQLSEAASQDAVTLLDVARASEREGIDTWFDTGHWLQSKMEIAPQSAALYGDMVARVLAAQRGLSKKCLVFDLDNTLWGGVVGDDGLEGIVLGEGSAVGEAHLALQRYAKQLKERGVILAVCSKNDPEIAETAFRDHPEMHLRRSDIAAFIANWDDKRENLERIAAKLNIGIDSLVFVDDNPAERARIRQSLPMVSVPELPNDPADYVRCLADAGYFEAVTFTPEDQQRTAQYVANAERADLLGSSQSMADFLSSLKMSVSYGAFTPVDLARITQLINKTNQFNPTTRRYTAEQIAAFASAPDVVTLQFRLVDRFGDNGLVSTMILRSDPATPGSLMIDTWVMSCRVFGRELEFEAMTIAVEEVSRRGVQTIYAEYIPTSKNSVVKDLFSNLGFRRTNDPNVAGDVTRWSLNLSDYIRRETHIARKVN
jgi:FkbH-like protein